MSLVNFRVDSDRALIAVDTIAGTSNFKIHANKMFPIPHAGLIVCGRGSHEFLKEVAGLCALLSGIDEVRELLPHALPHLLTLVRIKALLLLKYRREVMEAQEVYVFGWSDAKNEMTVIAFKKERGSREFSIDEDIYESVAPKLNREFPPLDSVEALMRVAAEQVRDAMQDDPSKHIGGRLIVAELTREACKVRCAGDINYDHMSLYRSGTPGKA